MRLWVREVDGDEAISSIFAKWVHVDGPGEAAGGDWDCNDAGTCAGGVSEGCNITCGGGGNSCCNASPNNGTCERECGKSRSASSSNGTGTCKGVRVGDDGGAGWVFLFMYAPWCPFSSLMAPSWHRLAQKFPKVEFLRMDAHKDGRMASRFMVRGYPSLLLFFRGKLFQHYTTAR